MRKGTVGTRLVTFALAVSGLCASGYSFLLARYHGWDFHYVGGLTEPPILVGLIVVGTGVLGEVVRWYQSPPRRLLLPVGWAVLVACVVSAHGVGLLLRDRESEEYRRRAEAIIAEVTQ